jgi:dTDP-4-dehydrorhamnose reductase
MEPLGVRPDLILHAAAWTDVDGAEEHRVAAEAVNVLGTRNVVALGAPVVYFSTDYVFDGQKREPYLESDQPGPLSVYGETKLAGEHEVRAGWVVRTSWLFGWTGRNFVRTMLALSERQSDVRVVADQIGCPTYVAHLAAAVPRLLELPHGTRHITAAGECSWADFAEAIFELAGCDCHVERVTSEDPVVASRLARRPRYSVLRSEHTDTPRLPHWRAGLEECLRRLGALR